MQRGLRMASQNIPMSMRAIALSKYGKPSEYDIGTLPVPKIEKPDDVLIRVHAASINPVDVKFASGVAKMMQKDTFPYKIGFDAAGTIAAVGSSVTSVKVGDEVYTRIPNAYKGTTAEYVLSRDSATAKMPTKLDFVQSAAIPLAGLTALQAMEKADSELPGGLKGKTVFVPGGLSGTGSFAVLLAKNVFGAGKVITTLSTGKIAKAKELLGDNGSGGLQIVDYTKEDVAKAIGKGQVDYMFDTMGQTMSLLSIMKNGGVIISISTIPSGTAMSKSMPDMPFIVRSMLNLVDWFFRWWIGLSGVKYSYIFMSPDAKGLEKFAKWVDEGKINPIVGSTAKLSDIEAVRKGCQQIFDGKGGIGKFVVEID